MVAGRWRGVEATGDCPCPRLAARDDIGDGEVDCAAADEPGRRGSLQRIALVAVGEREQATRIAAEVARGDLPGALTDAARAVGDYLGGRPAAVELAVEPARDRRGPVRALRAEDDLRRPPAIVVFSKLSLICSERQ